MVGKSWRIGVGVRIGTIRVKESKGEVWGWILWLGLTLVLINYIFFNDQKFHDWLVIGRKDQCQFLCISSNQKYL